MTTLAADSLVFARRNAAHIRQIPEKLLDVTLQPLMFVLLFAFVFGGVIDVPGSNYKEYLIGGILVQSLAFGMMGPGVSIATDLTEGVIDRFRSLPVSRAAYLIGHLISELGAAMIGLVVMLVTGLIVGWRVHEDVFHAAAAIGLLILFSSAMIWVGTLIGLISRSADAVQGLMFMTVFPLTFLSNAFVPADGLPDGLRAVANWNPVSAIVAAVRTLFGNAAATPHDAPWPLQHPVVAALAWCVLMLAVAVPLTLARYRQRTTD
ncbi:MAG: type transport system permease protein [Solirubrobacteraceae bacterium]|jgi:ABC transporter DrrB family efflux protein|nr:type transport system permease protein [Solirubrobacteraceae bacterium]